MHSRTFILLCKSWSNWRRVLTNQIGFVTVDDTKPAHEADRMCEKGESVGSSLKDSSDISKESRQTWHWNSPIGAERFLGLAVGTKVDCSRWRDADDIRTKSVINKYTMKFRLQTSSIFLLPFEQSTRAFILHDVSEALEDAHWLWCRRNSAVWDGVHLKRLELNSDTISHRWA